MSFIDFLTVDQDAFDEAEASDLKLHYRQEQRRHHKFDKKLTALIWLVAVMFTSQLASAPELLKTAAKGLITALLTP